MNEPPSPNQLKVGYDLFWGAAAYVLLFVGGPYLLTSVGIIEGVEWQQAFTLFLVACSLLLTMFYEKLADGAYYFYRFGFQCCVIGIGAAISGIVFYRSDTVTLVNEQLAEIGGLIGVANSSSDLKVAATYLFIALLVGSLVIGFFNAHIITLVREGDLQSKNILAIVTSLLGGSVMLANISLMILVG